MTEPTDSKLESLKEFGKQLAKGKCSVPVPQIEEFPNGLSKSSKSSKVIHKHTSKSTESVNALAIEASKLPCQRLHRSSQASFSHSQSSDQGQPQTNDVMKNVCYKNKNTEGFPPPEADNK